MSISSISGLGANIGISTSAVSNLSEQDMLVSQLNNEQTQMNELETEISTGEQFQLPSQDPEAALQVMSIQSLLQNKSQAQSNISTIQSSLSQSDSTLTNVSNLLTSIQSTALSVVGSTSSTSQRQVVIQQIDQAVQQLVTLGNSQFNGQNLFGGTDTTTAPFSVDAAGNVVYSGNATPTETYGDVGQLVASSVTGVQAFGAISQPVEGTALAVALSPGTPLADLNGGQGVSLGSVAVSNGQSTSIVNLTGAQTLGDVANLIEENPPTGSTVNVDITPTGLTLQLQPASGASAGSDNLSVSEVNNGSTASDLGILDTAGVGGGQLVGQPLNADITATTSLDDLFGSKAQANIHFGQTNSDIVLQANTPGASLNGVEVQFNSGAPAAGQESATYTPATGSSPGVLTVSISTSSTSASIASQVVAAINAVPNLPFTASLDQSNQNGSGEPPITALPPMTTTSGGSGTTFDTSGLQVTSEGKTYTIDVSGDKTVQDLLNSINNSGAGLDAQINSAKDGINVSSRISGSDFAIGENGGSTATQLGLRTFVLNTQLSQLNGGLGVGVNTLTAGGTDFTISETSSTGSSVEVPVSIAGDKTVGDVIDSINTAAAQAGATFTAQLAPTGNGIEITDTSTAVGPIVVTADPASTAAVDLGLVPTGQTTSTSAASGAAATGTEASPTDNELEIQVANPAVAGTTQVAFVTDPTVSEGQETVQYANNTLTFTISPQSTANDVIAALENSAYTGDFTASLDTTSDPANTGTGIVQQQTIPMSNGTASLGANSELSFQAVIPGIAGNVQVIFQQNSNVTAGNETVSYDATAGTLTFQVSSQTTANDIIAALQNSAYSSDFTASLDTSTDLNNNGSGVVQPQTIQMSGGQEVLTGSDTNPQQTDSVFNALIKLSAALQSNNDTAIQQSMTLLSNSMQTVNNAHDVLGVQEQSLTTLNSQISNEVLNLQTAMSNAYDTNMAEAVSDYTTAQIAYQATLETTASLLKTTLLNYL